MKKEFEILNKINNKEEFKEVDLSSKEKTEISDRILKKINNKKKKKFNNKRIAVASICLILFGGITINSEVVQATISEIGKSIGSFFEKETVGLNTYTKSILKEVESNGIKFIINEAIVDDNTLLISATVDYKDFDNESIGLKTNKKISMYPGDMNNFSIEQNGVYVNGSSEGGQLNYNKELKTTNILYSKQIENEELTGDYTIDIKLDKMVANSNGKEKFIEGNWDISFIVNSDELKKKVNVIDINKEIELTTNDISTKVLLSEIRVSPVSIRFKYMPLSEELRDKNICFKFEDQDGNEIIFQSEGGNSEEGLSYKHIVENEITSLKAIPGIGKKGSNKIKYYYEQAEIVNIK